MIASYSYFSSCLIFHICLGQVSCWGLQHQALNAEYALYYTVACEFGDDENNDYETSRNLSKASVKKHLPAWLCVHDVYFLVVSSKNEKERLNSSLV